MAPDPVPGAEAPQTEIVVGALGHGAVASVDPRGAVASAGFDLDWWVGADDRWHIPADETGTRRYRPYPAPIVETAVRIPSGDAIERVYAAAVEDRAVAVVEIENRSPAPFTAALIVRIARTCRVELDGTALRLDGEVALVLPRPPGAWAAAAATREIVTGGAARSGPLEPLRGPIELALLFPVAHRTTLRVALTGSKVADTALDLRALPDADAVARGWERQLERGMQAALPSPFDAQVDGARADLLLAHREDADVVAALEDWGFDSEAVDGWARLGWAGRRRARRRSTDGDPWDALKAIDAEAHPAQFLGRLRSVLVRESAAEVELLPGFPPDWLGQSVTVDAVPLRAGTLSFAVRWHGPRPALLWEAPAGVTLRVPSLDPGWSSQASAGEALLAAPPASLLSMGAGDRTAGAPVPAPGEFS